MKKILILTFIVAISFAFKTNAKTLEYSGYGYFYSELSPYGTWIQIDGGVNVWRPMHLRNGWLPYKYGRWMWTNDGWYWDSDEPFGYIVFHYGRWYYDDYYGWIWIPDDQWAPAWVEWRYDNDYIGWAPLPPYASFSINFGIHFSINFSTPYSHWHFVKYRYMCDRDVYRYYVPDRYKYRVYSDTRYRTNYGYSDGRVINRGVDIDYVRKRSGTRIVERNIERVNSPRELNNSRDRNSNTVRTFVIPRDQMDRNDNRNYEIKRGVRSSSLDVNRMDIGRDRTTEMNRNNESPRINDRNNVRENSPIQQRPEPSPRIDRRDNNNRDNQNYQPDRREQNYNPGNQERSMKQEPRNENRNSRPEVRRESEQKRAPEPRRESKDNRNNNSDSQPRRNR